MKNLALPLLITLVACGNRSDREPTPAPTLHKWDAAVGPSDAASKHEAMNYQEFLSLAQSIGEGTPQDELRKKLGTPHKAAESWTYDLSDLEGFPGFPPPVGSQVFAAVTYEFQDGKVSERTWAWMDSTGPAPSR